MNQKVKIEVICVICNLVLDDPITFSCDCLSCNVHLHDHFAEDNKITCPTCNQVFQIPKEGFRSSNKSIKNIVNIELYLSGKKKELRNEIQTLLENLKNKVEEFLEKAGDLNA